MWIAATGHELSARTQEKLRPKEQTLLSGFDSCVRRYRALSIGRGGVWARSEVLLQVTDWSGVEWLLSRETGGNDKGPSTWFTVRPNLA